MSYSANWTKEKLATHNRTRYHTDPEFKSEHKRRVNKIKEKYRVECNNTLEEIKSRPCVQCGWIDSQHAILVIRTNDTYRRYTRRATTPKTLRKELQPYSALCKSCFLGLRHKKTANHPVEIHQPLVNNLLGMSASTASQRLKKNILYYLVKRLNENYCFKCGDVILGPDDLTIEHKLPWRGISAERFWDLDNIAFSHAKCNKPHSRNRQ